MVIVLDAADAVVTVPESVHEGAIPRPRSVKGGISSTGALVY